MPPRSGHSLFVDDQGELKTSSLRDVRQGTLDGIWVGLGWLGCFTMKRCALRTGGVMTAIWHNNGEKWAVLSPTGFPDEEALHALVEDAPHLLPLSGAPNLAVVGREVKLGVNFADLIAIE